MTVWICPRCQLVTEPVWTWEHVQADEAYHIPTCPRCGHEMVEAEPCPICEEPMLPGQPTCLNCHVRIKVGIQDVLDGISPSGLDELTKWYAAWDVCEIISHRLEKKRREEDGQTSNNTN